MPTLAVHIEENAPIPTWFNIGGRARRLARPASLEELRACLEIAPDLRVLGDGANLLVADAGVEELVVVLNQGEFAAVKFDESAAAVQAGAGAKLPQLITEAARLGLGGLEVLGGIPASVGGAVVMNAGGAFGQTADVVAAVHCLDRQGREHTFRRNQIEFTYRRSRFGEHRNLIVTAVDFKLKRGDGAAIRAKLKDVMAYKKRTQPLAEHSAGCFFKNPTLREDLRGIAVAGSQVSAGMLIDKAGCKGMRVGGAEVSPQHGNFVTTAPGATAAHVLTLMRQVRAKVQAAFGVTLEPEVVVWGDSL